VEQVKCGFGGALRGARSAVCATFFGPARRRAAGVTGRFSARPRRRVLAAGKICAALVLAGLLDGATLIWSDGIVRDAKPFFPQDRVP